MPNKTMTKPQLLEYVAELEAAVSEYEAMSRRTLAENIGIRKMEITDGKIDFIVQGPMLELITASFARLFKLAGGPNYCGWAFNFEGEPFELTLQRVNGKTASQIASELRQKLLELTESAA